MKAVKETIRKYYKYLYEPWTQPILTSNGTMGGGSFAVSAVDEHAVNQGYKAYFCFASNANSSEQITWQSDANPSSYTMYNSIPLKITNIKITNRCAYTRAMASGTIYGSNDNSNWVQLTTFTNTNNNASATWNINLSQNETAYKYYKIGNITNIESGLVGIGKITITATARTIADGTEQDYDFYKDLDVYKIVKETVRKYYKYYDYSDTFNFVQNGTRTDSGWQSVSTDVNYLYGTSNAYEMGQGSQNSLVYTYNDTIPATTYTFNLSISGQGNGYVNNPTVTVTYEDSTQEVVYTKSFSGSSLNEDFVFTATAPIKSIALTSYLTHSSSEYVGVWVTLKSKSYIVQRAEETTEQDYDFYRDYDEHYALKSWEKGQYYGN